ncbi:VOC family protein [Variovorax sp. JS1663]|uniref:VOC family protein n=1 Tax=Variovorax sp. JS1663 TaxID=1851577 RepID=UPI000B34919F|nr:VOC family protein [Variovorax sp. JS1663]OUL98049.1 extradiol dioxygenase [Variovorax sp. JS1663]
MATKIFVNLPVRNVEKSKAFYLSLGYRNDARFTDEKAACMVISDEIHVMLLHVDYFKTFTPKAIADASESTEVLLCLSCESRAEVDAQVAKAVAGGGSTPNKAQDHGFMYQHGFQDLDGHMWELAYMDMSAFPQA